MTYNASDIVLIAIFIAVIGIRKLYARGVLTMEMLYALAQENITMYAFLAILLFFVRRNKSPAPTPTPIPVTINTDIDELKQDMLAIKNEIARMQSNTE